METVKASATWSREADRYTLWVEDQAAGAFVPDSLEDYPLAALLLELDEAEQETGRIAGFEIPGFLEFDRWDALPELDLLWQLPGQEPLPLNELQKREERRLRQQVARCQPGVTSPKIAQAHSSAFARTCSAPTPLIAAVTRDWPRFSAHDLPGDPREA